MPCRLSQAVTDEKCSAVKAPNMKMNKIVQDHVVQAQIRGIFEEGIVRMEIPTVTRVKIKDHVDEKQGCKGKDRFAVHEAQ